MIKCVELVDPCDVSYHRQNRHTSLVKGVSGATNHADFLEVQPLPPELDVVHLSQRVDTLETTCAYQEKVIEDLNAVFIELSGQLQSFRQRVASLEDRLRDLQDRTPQDQQDEPPPPHY